MKQKAEKTDTGRDGAKASYTRKMALAVGSISAAALLPAAAQSATIYTNSDPKTLAFGDSSVIWDVDGDGNADFSLEPSSTAPSYLDLETFGLNASGLVQRTGSYFDRFRNLATGFTVGTSMAAGYRFDVDEMRHRTIVFSSNVSDVDATGFVDGTTGYFGFRFKAGDNLTHYGWASMLIDSGLGSPGTQRFTIAEWAYNDVAGGSIQVGDQGAAAAVPEPATLATLALGAAALLAWRRKRNRRAVPQSKEI